jgi:hypothetical protein
VTFAAPARGDGRSGAECDARALHPQLLAGVDSRNSVAPICQILARVIAHAIRTTIVRVSTQPGPKPVIARALRAGPFNQVGSFSYVFVPGGN